MTRQPKKMPAGEFKAKCLSLMDEVRKTRTSVIITKHGKAVAKLVPAEAEQPDFFGCMRDTVRIVGDMISPLDVEWEANG